MSTLIIIGSNNKEIRLNISNIDAINVILKLANTRGDTGKSYLEIRQFINEVLLNQE